MGARCWGKMNGGRAKKPEVLQSLGRVAPITKKAQQDQNVRIAENNGKGETGKGQQ